MIRYLSADEVAKIKQCYSEGWTKSEIARYLGVAWKTVHYHLDESVRIRDRETHRIIAEKMSAAERKEFFRKKRSLLIKRHPERLKSQQEYNRLWRKNRKSQKLSG